MRTAAVVVPPPAFDHDLGLRQRVEDLAVEQLVPELPPSPRSPGPPRPPAGPGPSARPPAAAWRRSPRPCAASLPSSRPPAGAKPYLREDHFSGGRPASWTTTRATVSTRAVRLTIEPATVPRISSAASGSPVSVRGIRAPSKARFTATLITDSM